MPALTYYPRETCSQKIDLEVEDGIIKSVKFTGGCSGNTQAIERLAVGMPAERAAELLGGIRCGARSTSCPDQLSRAIKSIAANNQKKS